MNKTEALMKNLLYEKVTVIHADRGWGTYNGCVCRGQEGRNYGREVGDCVHEDQQHHGCMVEQRRCYQDVCWCCMSEAQ